MKKRKIVLIINLLVILALIITLVVVKNTTTKGNNVPDNDNNEENEIVIEEPVDENSYTKMVKDVKVNISEKLHEIKSFEDFTVEHVELVYGNEKTAMIIKLKNNSNLQKGDFDATVVLKNTNGNTIETLDIYINHMDPGEVSLITAYILKDYSNAYDYEIKR